MTGGTPLGPTQLNAAAVGVDGGSLAGEFFYLPGAGTVLPEGAQPVSVEFQPISGNYRNAIMTVTITVLPVEAPSRLKFIGFFRPVHNLPFVNTVAAGRGIPVMFSVQGAKDARVLKEGSPTSVPVVCNAAATTQSVVATADEASNVLLSRGDLYTYVWQTSPAWAGSCRKLIVTLVDGSKHEALFRFGKPVKPKLAKVVKRAK